MPKSKYQYNPNTLNYEKIELSLLAKARKAGWYIAYGLCFGSLMVFASLVFFESPKELLLKRENKQLLVQYKLMNEEINRLENVLKDIQHRDDNVYRVIFEADPIPENIRKAGVGGINRYNYLEGYQNSSLVVETKKRLDNIAKQLYIQSKSFDEVIETAKKKEEMLASLPAIQPISNKDLTRMASGYGNRIDPIYKTIKFHAGMDFTAPTGTPIYATGDGTVTKVAAKNRGYGHHIILQHGFGYETLYGHMSAFNVKVGDKVKRGDVIGFVGNTGKSVGPHLHYEVIKDGKTQNPINYYFNDLTPEQYEKMIEMSSGANQSFD